MFPGGADRSAPRKSNGSPGSGCHPHRLGLDIPESDSQLSQLSSTQTLTRYPSKWFTAQIIKIIFQPIASLHFWLREGNWEKLFQLSSDLCYAAVKLDLLKLCQQVVGGWANEPYAIYTVRNDLNTPLGVISCILKCHFLWTNWDKICHYKCHYLSPNRH